MTRRASIPWIVVILFVALTTTTTAIAAPTVAKAITKGKVKKIATAQANKAIDARAPGLKVATAGTATTAGTADIALSPVAFAVVRADGTLVPGRARGITQAMVTKQATSAYCFNVPFAFKTAQVTPTYPDGQATDVTASVGIQGSFGPATLDCTPTPSLEVAMVVDSEFAAGNGFTIWFYN